MKSKALKVFTVATVISAVALFSFLNSFSKHEDILAAEKQYKVATGYDGGTYHKIGESLNKLPGFKVKTVPTSGSTENIRKVRRGEADFGISQLDIFENLSYFDKSLKQDVKILFLLYKEEVHLLTKKSYSNLRQLRGKKVAFGAKDSGTFSTAQILVAAMQLNETNFVVDHSAPADAIKKLLQSEVEAMLFVGGAPVELLAGISAKDGANLHFLTFDAETMQFLTEGYLPYLKTNLVKANYPNLIPAQVSTISTSSAIIVRTSMSDAEVEDIIKAIFTKTNRKMLDDFHPKWKEVKVKETRDYYNKNKESFHDAVVKTFKSL